MKRMCGVCGKEFEGYRNQKYCPTCKAEGKKLCSMCGKVIQVGKNRHYCPECERVRWHQNHEQAAKRQRWRRGLPRLRLMRKQRPQKRQA